MFKINSSDELKKYFRISETDLYKNNILIIKNITMTHKIKRFDGNIQRIRSSTNRPLPLTLYPNALANLVGV
jgi:hypothetical protein